MLGSPLLQLLAMASFCLSQFAGVWVLVDLPLARFAYTIDRYRAMLRPLRIPQVDEVIEAEVDLSSR